VSVGALGGNVGHNVIAKPPGRECETVTGGHFDSVLQAPGASDNATGTATTIEIAAVLAHNGSLGANCFVLFGGEEKGLVGSRAFVTSLSPEQRARIRAVLNLDMVGVGDDSWLLIGSTNLQNQGQVLADQLGIKARRGQLDGASSDHASFINAGIPALMLHRWEDPLLHTPQDVSTRVRPELLAEAARFGIAFLQSLAPGGG
jgi:aminopeptidase YwaD